MKRFILYGTAVLALSASPSFAQVGSGTSGQGGVTPVPNGATQPPSSGGITDQGGSRPGTGTPDGATPAPEPGTGATVGIPQGSGAGNDGERGTGAKRENPNRDAKAAAPAADETFVMEAAQGGMAEVELGKLAVQKASNSRVKEFGQRMVTDHTKANDNLKTLAMDKKITIPSDLDAKSKATRDRLAKLSGSAFDQAYIQEMVSDHKKDVADFQKESESGLDAAVKAFAAKTLPTLQEHTKMVEDINMTLGHSAVGTSGSNPAPR